MVAQSEVEKLREELGRVRSEGTGNLFGENQAIVGRSVMIWSFFYGCVGRFIGPSDSFPAQILCDPVCQLC